VAACKGGPPINWMLTWDVLPLLLNISSTVGIVFVNKYVMRLFPFAMTVTLVHQMTAGTIIIIQRCALRPEKPLPFLTDVWIGLITVGSIYFCNQSLRINSVTLYQVAKLLNIPTMCFFQYMLSGKKQVLSVYLSLVVLSLGVGIATVAELDISTSMFGLVMAALGILVTVIDQMEVGRLKAKYEATAICFLHSNIFHRWAVGSLIVGTFEPTAPSEALDVGMSGLMGLAVSCLLATSINITQVSIIGKFGPLTINVVGHVKTLMILTLGMAWNQPPLGVRLFQKIFGIALGMAGAIKYGQLTNFPKSTLLSFRLPSFLQRRHKALVDVDEIL